MGLDIGIISVSYLPRPSGVAYEFACELAELETSAGYGWGEGHSWGWIEREEVSALAESFARERGLAAPERASVRAWVASLPPYQVRGRLCGRGRGAGGAFRVVGGAPFESLRTGFDGLRANGGAGHRRARRLWIPASAGMTMGAGVSIDK